MHGDVDGSWHGEGREMGLREGEEGGSRGKVGGTHLVERREARAVPLDAAHLTQCLLERRAECYRAVL